MWPISCVTVFWMSVDTQFVGVVEPGTFEEPVDVHLLGAFVLVVLTGAEPE